MGIQKYFPALSERREEITPIELGRGDGDLKTWIEDVWRESAPWQKGQHIGEIQITTSRSPKAGFATVTADFTVRENDGDQPDQESFKGIVPEDNGKLGPGKVRSGSGLSVNLEQQNPKRWSIEGGG